MEALLDNEYFLRKLQLCHGDHLEMGGSLVEFQRQLAEIEDQKAAYAQQVKTLTQQLRNLTEEMRASAGSAPLPVSKRKDDLGLEIPPSASRRGAQGARFSDQIKRRQTSDTCRHARPMCPKRGSFGTPADNGRSARSRPACISEVRRQREPAPRLSGSGLPFVVVLVLAPVLMLEKCHVHARTFSMVNKSSGARADFTGCRPMLARSGPTPLSKTPELGRLRAESWADFGRS